MVVIATIAMLCGFLAQHLGLTESVAAIFTKISKCPKCTTFWITLLALILLGTNPFIALPLSLTCAYLSNWIGLLFMWLNQKYNKIWERLNKQK